MNAYVSILGAFSPMAIKHFPRQLKKVLSVGVVTVLAGCSSLGVGSSDYACQGMPGGVQCMSTRDVYEATNDGNVPRSISAEDARDGVTSVPAQVAAGAYSAGDSDSREAAFVNTYVAPNLPDRPIPIRTPAQVMRIWVAPWEDKNGDLNVTGYLYTEIEPRRWVIGDAAPEKSPVLHPLQVTRPANRPTSTTTTLN